MGNPTNYLGKEMQWRGRKLIKAGDVEMEYDYNGLRVRKGDRRYYWYNGQLKAELWDRNGQDVYIYYYYDESGVSGMHFAGYDYYFRKNIFGDVLAIYDIGGNLQCRYVYDAWGNCKAYDKDGNEPRGGVGYFNPFRFRGYYWDRELGLYYLQSRYYDPELCRFISADDVNYLDPASITGLNLYAYCGNNPVMYVDPSGHDWLDWLIAGVITAGLIIGAAIATVASGGVASPTLAAAAELGASLLTGAAFGATLSLTTQAISGDIDLNTFFIDVGVGAASGLFSFGVGQIFSTLGKGVGIYLNQITIKGLNVGKVFGRVFPALLQKAGAFIGGVFGGMFIDRTLNDFLGRTDNLQQRLYNNVRGSVFSSILEIIRYLW